MRNCAKGERRRCWQARSKFQRPLVGHAQLRLVDAEQRDILLYLARFNDLWSVMRNCALLN